MTDARLWRLPPHFGGCRTAPLQLKSSSQLAIESELETTLRNTEDRCDAQEPRADFGICLIGPKASSAGDQMAENLRQWSLARDPVAKRHLLESGCVPGVAAC